jgi:hypothetical protein
MRFAGPDSPWHFDFEMARANGEEQAKTGAWACPANDLLGGRLDRDDVPYLFGPGGMAAPIHCCRPVYCLIRGNNVDYLFDYSRLPIERPRLSAAE